MPRAHPVGRLRLHRHLQPVHLSGIADIIVHAFIPEPARLDRPDSTTLSDTIRNLLQPVRDQFPPLHPWSSPWVASASMIWAPSSGLTCWRRDHQETATSHQDDYSWHLRLRLWPDLAMLVSLDTGSADRPLSAPSPSSLFHGHHYIRRLVRQTYLAVQSPARKRRSAGLLQSVSSAASCVRHAPGRTALMLTFVPPQKTARTVTCRACLHHRA